MIHSFGLRLCIGPTFSSVRTMLVSLAMLKSLSGFALARSLPTLRTQCGDLTIHPSTSKPSSSLSEIAGSLWLLLLSQMILSAFTTWYRLRKKTLPVCTPYRCTSLVCLSPSLSMTTSRLKNGTTNNYVMLLNLLTVQSGDLSSRRPSPSILVTMRLSMLELPPTVSKVYSVLPLKNITIQLYLMMVPKKSSGKPWSQPQTVA